MQNKAMTITVIRSTIIYISIVLAVRIMGKRQIGELKPHELVITILISAVATIPIEENTIPLTNSLIPILIFVSFEILESALSMKSLKFRDLLQGKPVFVIKDGVLQQKQLRRLRFTIDDLIDASRQAGTFDISEIQNAIIETNGTLSIQNKAEHSPITPNQLGIEVEQSQTPLTIVMDRKPIIEYFGQNIISEKEIELLLTANNLNINDLMILTIDNNGKLFIVRRDKK